MQSQRRKPRRTNVRTGCITCKRRRVKCPEERPYCSRCLDGGFACAGYAVPKPWIFVSKTDAERGQGSTQPKASLQDPPMESASTSIALLDRDVDQDPPRLPSFSSLQLGNSDPFNAYAVKIGPNESYLLRFYQTLIQTEFHRPGLRCALPPATVEQWRYHNGWLKDEAAAYALFTRNAALAQSRRGCAYASPPLYLLRYTAMAQAALSRKLSLLDGTETPETVYTTMWASGLLAAADLYLNTPNTHLHLRAMGQMMVFYAEMMGPDLQPDVVLQLSHTIIIRALLTMTKPTIDMTVWFPRIFQPTWIKTAALWSTIDGKERPNPVHSDVKDPLIHAAIVNLRGADLPFGRLLHANTSGEEKRLLTTAFRSQEVYRYGQLLHMTVEVADLLSDPASLSDLTLEQTGDHMARAYLSLSLILWMNLTSRTYCTSNRLIDTTPVILRHLRTTMIQSMSHWKSSSNQDEPYAAARLWSLYVGLQTEYQRRNILKLDPTCGKWFFVAFREQAISMRISSWQYAVTLLEQILYRDDMRPHISEWWGRVFAPHVPSLSIPFHSRMDTHMDFISETRAG